MTTPTSEAEGFDLLRGLRSTETWLGRAVGGCEHCGTPNAVDNVDKDTVSECRHCGVKIVLKWVFGNKSDIPCDGRCMGATSDSCSCACGGRNHGAWNLRIELVPVWDRAKAEANTRSKREQHEARQRVKAEANRNRKRDAQEVLLEQWPDLVWLSYLQNLDDYIWSRFLEDMRSAFVTGKMTPRQAETGAAAVMRAMEQYEREHARERADAELVQAGVHVPEVEGMTVVGTVYHTKYDTDYRYSYSGRTVARMFVETTMGFRLMGTPPPALVRAVGGQLSALKGCKVRFVADVQPSKNDQLFGFWKFAKQAEVIERPSA
jgi:DNA-directed RNA polymerase subunit RPC12/RpoP